MYHGEKMWGQQVMQSVRPDLDQAISQMNAKVKDSWLSGSWSRLLDTLDSNLEPGEPVLRLAAGYREGGHPKALWILTPRKVLVISEGWIVKSQETIPLDLITSASARRSLLWSDIKTTGAQSTDVLCQVNKADADAFVAELRSLLTARSGSTVSVSSSGIADELRKLADLRSQGILTDEEFQSHKARLLA